MTPDHDPFESADEEDSQGMGIEPTPGGFAHWVAEQYLGDERFESVEVVEPGPLDEESVRVKFMVTPETHFLVSVLADDAIVRMGLATDDKELVARIEEMCEEIGGNLNDLVADALELDDELEHEVEHYHDDVDYFTSDIQYQRDEDLFAPILRDEVIYYLEGYLSAFVDLIGEED